MLSRLKLCREFDVSLPEASADPGSREVTLPDAEALATLMLEAYRGTVDDAGEGPDEAAAEVRRLLSGGYGPFNFMASEVVEREGQIVAATLVTEHEGLPLVAFSLTLPAWQRRGLARAGLIRTMHRLHESGAKRVQLAVTLGNTPAEQLYASLGFVQA
ncbi:MAG: GNAT family N-acetyltransferase [Planctomycetota bacterium]|nr:GNAT family N-acetyltransferase [Planctomycetota bacterium]